MYPALLRYMSILFLNILILLHLDNQLWLRGRASDSRLREPVFESCLLSVSLDAFHNQYSWVFVSFWLLSFVLFLAYQYRSCDISAMLLYNIRYMNRFLAEWNLFIAFKWNVDVPVLNSGSMMLNTNLLLLWNSS